MRVSIDVFGTTLFVTTFYYISGTGSVTYPATYKKGRQEEEEEEYAHVPLSTELIPVTRRNGQKQKWREGQQQKKTYKQLRHFPFDVRYRVKLIRDRSPALNKSVCFGLLSPTAPSPTTEEREARRCRRDKRQKKNHRKGP